VSCCKESSWDAETFQLAQMYATSISGR
jgi:hypothetical protein